MCLFLCIRKIKESLLKLTASHRLSIIHELRELSSDFHLTFCVSFHLLSFSTSKHTSALQINNVSGKKAFTYNSYVFIAGHFILFYTADLCHASQCPLPLHRQSSEAPDMCAELYAFLIYFRATINHTHIETNTYVLCYQNEDIIDFFCFYKKLIVTLTLALLLFIYLLQFLNF